MKQYLLLLPIISSACITTEDGKVIALDSMSQADYDKWRLYVSLGVKIGTNRLVHDGVIDRAKLEQVADRIEETVKNPVLPGTKSLLRPILEDTGLLEDEITLVLLVAENEIIGSGGLNDYTIVLSPRAKEVYLLIAGALRASEVVTEEELRMSEELGREFDHDTIQ